MGRILLIGGILLAVVVVIWAISHLQSNRQRKTKEQQQRDLVRFAPEVLRGDPLLDVVTAQGRRLEAAYAIMSALLADSTNAYLPSEHTTALTQWCDKQHEMRSK